MVCQNTLFAVWKFDSNASANFSKVSALAFATALAAALRAWTYRMRWSIAPGVLSRHKLESFEGKSVADAVTMSLMKFGKNQSVHGNLNFKVRPGVFLSAYVHPRPEYKDYLVLNS
ncbi:unnamed protein product [Soboliphyme baturini]|uniref:Peptidase_M10 domain-containing protein n=1 Tax=Soboliphyme baturini TaxID=241478 RepID=A0A183IA07_9BILA|nr:unnamed protein product [Soboliphyme baturini]